MELGWIWNSGVGVGIGVGVDILEICRSWNWSWSWNLRSWSWSWYYGDLPELELELKHPELELELIFWRLAGVGVGVETSGVGVGVELILWSWPQPWLVLELSTVLALTQLGIRQSDWRRAGIRSTNLHIVVEYPTWNILTYDGMVLYSGRASAIIIVLWFWVWHVPTSQDKYSSFPYHNNFTTKTNNKMAHSLPMKVSYGPSYCSSKYDLCSYFIIVSACEISSYTGPWYVKNIEYTVHFVCSMCVV